MQRAYHRLRAEERKVIFKLKEEGFTQAKIAKVIGVSQSTISKELSRNALPSGYFPSQADCFAKARQEGKTRRGRRILGEIRSEVEARLGLKHSPEQISGKLRQEGIWVSHESIYEFVRADQKAGGELWKHLRINGKRRYRRRSKVGRGEKIPQRVDISDRPAEVAERERYGDWEADLIQGAAGSGYLLSLYERKSHLGKLYYLSSKESDPSAIGLITVLKEFEVHTITYDNGLEFSNHRFVNELLGSASYFCKPYHSWEKGGVENYNGLVRQYFPKGSDFREINPERLREVEAEINQRPRKCHGYASPEDFLGELQGVKAA